MGKLSVRVLSVDLGTSNTVAVLAALGRQPRVVEVDGSATMSSAVYANEDGTLLVGQDAERRARLDPSCFEPNPKRRVDEGTLLLGKSIVPVTEALAAVLRRVAEETARQLGGNQPDEVRLTHPAQWGPIRRNVLLAAARLAGFGSNLVLVPEPVAAAAHFASFPDQVLTPGQALAVYDLGAGTFDCAVVGATQTGFAVLAEDGLPDLGGLDVDQALLEHVGREVSHRDPQRWQCLLRPESTPDRRARRALLEDVKAAKEALSRHPQTEVPMPEPFDDVLVTRAELEALVRPALLRSVELLASTIRSAGMDPRGMAGIYLVGGSSRIPLVAQLLAEGLGVVPTSLDQPETAVALGAHGVPQDGISMRTQDLSGQLHNAGAETTIRSMQPVAFPGQQPPGYPASGPQPVQPMPAYPNTPYGGPPQQQPMGQQQPMSRPKPKGKRRTRALVISGVAALVVVLAVAGGIFYLNRPAGTVDASCVTGATANSQGFVPCLLTLAGAVPATGRCAPGDSTSLTGLATNVVTCQLGSGSSSYTVSYLVTTGGDAPQKITKLMLPNATTPLVEAEWQGNGLDGRYVTGVGDGIGALVFTVAGSPMLGVLSRVGSTTGSHKITADSMADYFEQNVQPGTAPSS
jgi:hypothetical protein